MEAGYASNEAFTRAFRRAFGLAPSRVPAHRKVTAMDLLTRMVEHHVWLVAGSQDLGVGDPMTWVAQPA